MWRKTESRLGGKNRYECASAGKKSRHFRPSVISIVRSTHHENSLWKTNANQCFKIRYLRNVFINWLFWLWKYISFLLIYCTQFTTMICKQCSSKKRTQRNRLKNWILPERIIHKMPNKLIISHWITNSTDVHWRTQLKSKR